METKAAGNERKLAAKQTEVKRKLADGTYRTLGRIIADRVGWFLQMVTFRPDLPPFWLSMTVTILALILFAYATVLISGDFASYRVNLRFQLSLWGALLVFVVALEGYMGIVFKVAQSHLLNTLLSVNDLDDLLQQLNSVFSVRHQFTFAIFYSLILTVISAYFMHSLIGVIGSGFIVSYAMLHIIGGSYFYCFLQGIRSLLRFSHYQYKLYSADPRRSEVIDQISDILSTGVYIVAIWAALFTLIMFSVDNSANDSVSYRITLAIVMGWAPTIVFFSVNQYILSRIITSAKWRTLDDIQSQIQELQNQEPILSPETLGHLDTLMDYHDRVANTRSSALDIRAGLNFLNSLLLPLLAFVLANLNQFVEIFLTYMRTP